MLAIALEMDLKKIDLYIRMKERKQAKKAYYKACTRPGTRKEGINK